jgi:peptidoglycan-associated lipoprotein
VATNTDFVQTDTQPVVTRENLPNDVEELNRVAQSRGYIRDAFFGFDESALPADAQAALNLSADWLKKHPEYNVLIEGHCDERGTEQYNLALGDRRANTAKQYLTTLGVDASRMRTVSYGEERPFDQGHDEAAWAKNRRAHLVLVGK